MPVVYQDELLFIETDVDMRNPKEELEISTSHSTRDLSNSIKIKVNSSEAHFIQFVTRIVPDMCVLPAKLFNAKYFMATSPFFWLAQFE